MECDLSSQEEAVAVLESAMVVSHRLLTIQLPLYASPLGFLDFCGSESDNSLAQP